MEAPKRRKAGRRRYQGTRAIATALITTVFPGLSLLAFSAGALHNAKADLQRTADAAALAASAMLLQDDVDDPTVLPRATERRLAPAAAGGWMSAIGVDDAESGRAVCDNAAGGNGFALSQTFPDAVSAHALSRGRAAVERRVGILALPAGVTAGRQWTQTIAEPHGRARSQVQGAVARGTIELRQALAGLGGARPLRLIRQT